MRVLYLIIFLSGLTAFAEDKLQGGFTHRLVTSLSLTSLSLNEQSSTGGSYSGSAINLGIEYPFVQSIGREYFIKSSVPVVAQSGAGVYSALLGLNNFNAKLSAPYRLEEGATNISIRPKTQYYWGGHIGAGAAVYNIETAKKSDFAFLVGGQLGGTKQFKAPWGMKGELTASKGFGINSGFLTYSLGVSAIYDLE